MGVLGGRAVVITGAGRGLGRAYARCAAAEGARVVVNDIVVQEAERVAAEINDAGGTALADGHSVAAWDGAAALIDRCVGEFGALDGLVNNAAVYYRAEAGTDTEEQLRTIVEVNLLGTLFCGCHAIRRMRRQGKGVILNVTSGAQIGLGMLAAYGATKGGVASLTYNWALDLERENIRVNALSPLGVTNISQNVLDAIPSMNPAEIPTLPPDRYRDLPPPENTGPLVAYLLSDLSAGITGQLVRLDGRELSLLQHPAVIPPVEVVENWTVEEIDAAFRRTLRQHQQPFGLAAPAHRS